MILDPRAFIAKESPLWDELEKMVERLGRVGTGLSLDEAERFHYLYLRTGSALARLGGLSAGAATRRRLEDLLARAHGVSASTAARTPFQPRRWTFELFPRAFQRQARAWWMSVAATLVGVALGAGLLAYEPRLKPWLLPYEHLRVEPHERVAREEAAPQGPGVDRETTFAAFLMSHNIQVSLMVFGLGLTLGIGSLVLLLTNGMLLGAVCWDYLLDGQGAFLAGWLLPHGSVEIPSVLLAGQAGLVLAAALVARGGGATPWQRVRKVAPDIMALLWGMAVLLVWAGIIESFFSQTHEPRLPYSVKTAFGLMQLTALFLFLFLPRRKEP